MKKTLAIVLALVMVLSVMAMIPASAAEPVLGWEILNNDQATITKVDGKTVKFSGKGYYGNPNNAPMMVSSEKVDISKGLTISISDATGFVTDAKDAWIIVGFTDKKQPTFTDASEQGTVVMIQPLTGKAIPHTVGGADYKWESWGGGVKYAGIDVASFGNGEKATISVEVAKSGAINQLYINNAAGSKKTNVLEGSYNTNRINAIDKTLGTLNGSAYVWVAISASKVAGDSTDANTLATSVVVNALKPEAAPVDPVTPVDPAPATGDFTAIYAVVAVIACAVVVGSTIVLKKKED